MLFVDRGVTLLSTVQHLPALTDFDLIGRGADYSMYLKSPISDVNGLPRCQELAALHSSSLTQLRLWMLDGSVDDNLLRLEGLPQLRSCQLRGEPEYGTLGMSIDAASFIGAPQLELLHLQDDEELQLHDGCLQRLTALTALKLIACDFEEIPPVVASLSMTLCVLDMSLNDHLQLDDATVGTVLGCSRLQKLGLHKDGASFDMESMASIVRLQRVFRQEHGQDLEIFFDGEAHEQCSAVSFDCMWPPRQL